MYSISDKFLPELMYFISQESTQLWDEIKTNRYLFDRKKLMAAALQKYTLTAEMVGLIYQYYLLAPASRTKFSSQFYGKNQTYVNELATSVDNATNSTSDKIVMIRQPVAFKKSASFLPVNNFEMHISVVK